MECKLRPLKATGEASLYSHLPTTLSMDKFVIITSKKPSARNIDDKSKRKLANQRFTPYGLRDPDAMKARKEWQAKAKEKIDIAKEGSTEDETKPTASSSAVGMKYGLSTLSHPGNPLTNGGSLNPPEYVWSCSSGHQRNEGGRGNVSAYQTHRNKRIEDQQEPPETSIFRDCRIYCNSGYCAGTTDLELRKLVIKHGGIVAHNEASATHILTSMTLSASKIQKLLTNRKSKQQVVKPEWLFDSITLGKRKQEWNYTVIKNESQKDLGFSSATSTSTSGKSRKAVGTSNVS